MEENELKEEARKTVDEIWETRLKKSFSNKIQECLVDTLKNLDKELTNFDNSMNKQIQELDKKFQEKWNLKFQDELSKLSIIKNKNNEINKINNNPYEIKNNNDNFNIIDNENENDDFNIIKNNDFKINIDNDFNNNNCDNYQNLRKKQIDLDQLKKPPKTKLILLGNTNPLINIILYSISNIEYLVKYFLNPVKENKILNNSKIDHNNYYLSPSFLKLLDYLWKSNQKEYRPKEIHDILKQLMKNDYNSDDAGLIIKYILNQLNDDINLNPKINKEDDNPYEHFDKKKTFNKFTQNFKQNITFISERFYSAFKIKKRCINCNSDYEYYFEAYPVIDIYLEANDNNILNNLYFEQHLKSLLADRENENIREQCIICASEQKKLVVKDILSTPDIVIININRKNDKNNTISFKYPPAFNGNNVINDQINLPNYELTTVIKKSNNNNFDYCTFYKSFTDNNWYSYNNEKIESVQNYQNYIFDEKNACVLIYIKKN